MKKVCIIGAGSSGIAAAKVLKDYGIAYDCFEKGSQIGGNWRYGNDNGMSSAYWSLHINTSREKMAYSDFPMPSHYPDFPHHTQIIAYFEDYVRHFGCKDHIQFNTEVTHIEPQEDGSYMVRTDQGQVFNYAAILVANGHHWKPRYPQPDFPGKFKGEVMHSHFYKTPDLFRPDKNVLIVGIGNSALDIASEAARHTRGKVTLSTRSGAHIIPKYIFGKPLDQFGNPESASEWPLYWQQAIYQLILRLSRGKQETYGVPTPKRPVFSEHPSVSQDFLSLAGHGRIQVKPNIKKLKADYVQFQDGSEAPVDILIYATGYEVSFPFLGPEEFPEFQIEENNNLQLYQRVVHPDYPNLYFIGLCQPLGAIMPLAELQSIWVAKLLRGTVALPGSNYLRWKIEEEAKKMNKQYIQSARHTLQVNFYTYKKELELEMKRMRTGKTIQLAKRPPLELASVRK